MRLILVRHGETACNLANIWHGWDDCGLTENGLAQAHAVAARLAIESVDVVYSSDTRRALQTAKAIAGLQGLEPIVDARLRERNAGDYEGRAMAEIVAERPTIWEERNANLWAWGPPGGETFQAVLDRALAAVRDIQNDHFGQTVVLVSHMGTTRALISHLAGIPIEKTFDLQFPSTGVSIFSVDGGAPRVEVLNDARHVTTQRLR
jgi:broad specificity phosphatase PhoE